MSTELLSTIGKTEVYQLSTNSSAFFYVSGMEIDADGGFRTYHPVPGKGLDHLSDAGRPGNWWALVTDNGKRSGRPIIQGASDPAPGFYVSTTSLQDKSRNRTDPRRYVDAESVPFIVLPGDHESGAKLRDLAYVVNSKNGKGSAAVFADTGPPGQVGEACMNLAERLGIGSNPIYGGTENGIVYLVFPGSNNTWPLSVAEIETKGEALFEKWGGMALLKATLSHLDWPAED